MAHSHPVNGKESLLSLPRGLAFGTLGVLAFSGTLPATRIAVPYFGPTLITLSRIEIAAVLSAITVLLWRLPKPALAQLPSIALMGAGLALGYPYFLALALETVPASHGAVVVGLTPIATAAFAVLRIGERPSPLFWIACACGVTAVAGFALQQGGGRIAIGDAWLALAICSVAYAYVEGGRVSRDLGSVATLCWSMLLLCPFASVALLFGHDFHDWNSVPTSAWLGFWYVGIISMFLGSVTWYLGLSAGGVSRIGQLNLVQPILGLTWAGLLLNEEVSLSLVVTAIVVLAAVAVCLRSRIS